MGNSTKVKVIILLIIISIFTCSCSESSQKNNSIQSFNSNGGIDSNKLEITSIDEIENNGLKTMIEFYSIT